MYKLYLSLSGALKRAHSFGLDKTPKIRWLKSGDRNHIFEVLKEIVPKDRSVL